MSASSSGNPEGGFPKPLQVSSSGNPEGGATEPVQISTGTLKAASTEPVQVSTADPGGEPPVRAQVSSAERLGVRQSEAARVRAVLEDARPGVRVLGISGPGGIGKSYLLREVVERMEAEGASWLKLSVDGSNAQVRGDLFALLDGQLARVGPTAPGQPRREGFHELHKVATMHRALVEEVAAELDTGAAPAEVKSTALELLRMGRRLNKVVPKSKELFDAIGTDEASVGPSLDAAWRVVANLRALRVSSWMPAPVRDLLGAGSKQRVRSDLWNLTAEALVADLTHAVAATARRAELSITTRVLIVIDDFEALAPVLEELLVGSLVPRLAEAPFASTVVILGRDALEAMHPAWSQHARAYLVDPIVLAPLDRDASLSLLAEAGVPEERREAMFEAAQGFPFLLGLLADEVREGGADGALFLRRFFDRTTRWLTDSQRDWFSRVVYLDAVNFDTLAALFPHDRVEAVQDWFEREASIRDPSAPVFRVRPLIREKVLRYLELRAPTRHREMIELAATARASGRASDGSDDSGGSARPHPTPDE